MLINIISAKNDTRNQIKHEYEQFTLSVIYIGQYRQYEHRTFQTEYL